MKSGGDPAVSAHDTVPPVRRPPAPEGFAGDEHAASTIAATSTSPAARNVARGRPGAAGVAPGWIVTRSPSFSCGPSRTHGPSSSRKR